MFGTVFAGGVLGALASVLFEPAILLAMPLAIIAMLVFLLWPSRVEVGADGVLIRWLASERFISHEDIAEVNETITGFGRNRVMQVIVKLTSGSEVRIPVTHPRWEDGRTAGLATRIREAREVWKRGGADVDALLVRGDRAHQSWVSALRAREVVGHRTAAIPKDRLWRVIEDAAAKPVERGGRRRART
jgi:hypothetical protein